MEHLPTDKAKRMLLEILVDFAEDTETLFAYLAHVGFDVAAVGATKHIPAAWLGHYRIRQGTYDTDRALNDLLTWPPISGRIFELQQEKLSLAK